METTEERMNEKSMGPREEREESKYERESSFLPLSPFSETANSVVMTTGVTVTLGWCRREAKRL